MSNTVPVPRTLLRRLWIALAAGWVSFGITTAQGFFREGYDRWHQAVSALSLGPDGWIQMLNLIAFGAVMVSTVSTWRRVLAGGTGGTLYPLFTAITGVSFVVVGIVPQDPAPGYDPAGLALQAPTALGLVHLAIAGVAALSSVAALFVIAARFAGDPVWRGWQGSAWTAAVTMIGFITVFGVWSTRPTGFAGTFERGAIVVPMLWMCAFLRRLSRGTPFMVSPPALTNEQQKKALGGQRQRSLYDAATTTALAIPECAEDRDSGAGESTPRRSTPRGARPPTSSAAVTAESWGA